MQQTATAEAPQQTVQKAAPKHLWKPGVSANPAGRPKGLQNKATRTIKEAIEAACQPGQCHPKGLAGWLVERAQGGVQDRQIFATFVAKAIPAQLQASVSADIVVQLPWLQARSVGRVGSGTHPRTQPEAIEAQVVEPNGVLSQDLRVANPQGEVAAPEQGRAAAENSHPDPHPPLEPTAGGEGK